MNYARVPDLLADLNNAGGSAEEPRCAQAIEEASDAARGETGGRRFHSAVETRYYSGDGCRRMYVGDLVWPTTVTLAPATVLVKGVDYNVWPSAAAENGEPYRALDVVAGGQLSAWPYGTDNIQIIGRFGYSEIKERVIGLAPVTGTVADTTGLTITASETVASLVYPGDTFFLEDEEIGPVVSVNTTAILVQARGINGTTAAAHSAKALYLRRYPAKLERAVRSDAARYLWGANQGYPEGSFREKWPAIAAVLNQLVEPASVI